MMLDTVHQKQYITSQISSSVCSDNGSRLYLTVPPKRVGSCGMIPKWDLRSWSPIVQMSRSSTMIFPSVGSTKRKRVLIRVVFPLPVRPTMPTLCPPSMLQVIPWRTSGAPGRYRTCKVVNECSQHYHMTANIWCYPRVEHRCRNTCIYAVYL